MKTFLQILFFFLLVTQICFAQWYEQNSGTTKNLNDVVFIDANVGIAVGDSGLILRTTDGGTLWSIVPTIVSNSLTSVCFVDSTNGWIGGNRLDIYPGDSSVIIRTTDSGMNWYKQADLDLYRVNDVFFVDQNNGFIVGWEGGGGNLFQTTNGGETWSDTTLPTYGIIQRVYFTDQNIGWILNRSCGVIICTSWIYKTTDGGNFWQTQMDSLRPSLNDISFTDSQNGIAVGNLSPNGEGIIYQTADGGETWLENQGPPFGPFDFVDAFHINESVIAMWGFNYDLGDVFYWSTDGGVTWQLRDSVQFNIPYHINRIFFTDTSNGWAVGDGGIILHTTNGGVTFIDNEPTQPTKFILEQNFPNPFNSSCAIRYSIPKLSQVLIKIFNTLGQEIETLLDEEKPVGTYELNWNAKDLTSGIYFYRLQASDFVQTRKMILLK